MVIFSMGDIGYCFFIIEMPSKSQANKLNKSDSKKVISGIKY